MGIIVEPREFHPKELYALSQEAELQDSCVEVMDSCKELILTFSAPKA